MFNLFLAYFIQKDISISKSESNHDHKNNLKLIPENKSKSKSKSKEIILSPREFMKLHWGWTI